MLPWWGWTLLWLVLVLGSAAVIAWRLRWLWRRFRAFLAAVDDAAGVVASLETRTEEVRRVTTPPAALTDPVALRRAYAATRAAQRAARRTRREERRPGWARPR